MIGSVILAVLAAAVLYALYFGYKLAFYYEEPQEDPFQYHRDDQTKPLENTLDQALSDFLAVEYERVSIVSQDGLTLTGRYYSVAEGGPLMIQMHGYKGNAVRDFCGVWPVAMEHGCNVLLVDQRCHGESQGHTITFGIKEHLDCCSWVDYACSRFGAVPMVLMGVSMGAATVLMASGRELPGDVKGIVADCPYDTPANIIKKVLKVEMGLPVNLVYPLIRLGGILYGRFDLEAYSPMEAIVHSKVPILLIHGDADGFVPHEMSCRLKETAPEIVEFHTIPGSGHAMNQVTDPALYRSILEPFLRRTL